MKNDFAQVMSAWGLNIRGEDARIIAAIKANLKVLEHSFIRTDERLLEVTVGSDNEADRLCRAYPEPPIPLGGRTVDGKKYQTYVIGCNLFKALQELQHS